jgi:uncharacterized protein involved in outer membrane biogenesis
MNRTLTRALLWTATVIGALVVIVVATLLLVDWNLLKHPIERVVSTASGRTVTIGGNLRVHVWTWTPTLVLEGLTIGNPLWETARPMATIERLEIHLKLLPLFKGELILPRVVVLKPDVYLHQDKSGRANWTFENQAPTGAPASKPARLPAMRDFLIESGKVTFLDDIRHLKMDGTIEAQEQASVSTGKPFHIQGTGTINDQPFELAELDLEAAFSGADLAEAYCLTRLALPNTPPFKLHAHIARRGMQVEVTQITGRLGDSDLRGALNIDVSRKRPAVAGELISTELRMKDLAASVGGKPKPGNSLDTKAGRANGKHQAEPREAPPSANSTALLFPDAALQLDRVRGMDADVHFAAESVDAGTVPLKKVAFRVKLDNGVLTLEPLAFEMPEGHLTGGATIDARQNVPKVHIDVRMKDIQMAQFKGKAPNATPPLGGVMQARLVIDGTGDSVHRVMADSNGMFTAILPNGEVRSALAELTGINLAKGLGLLLTNPNDQAEIRCGVAQFKIDDGTMNAENMTLDTENVLIKGKGNIVLGSEELHLEIRGEPKKLRLARLKTPVEIKGHLLKPSVGVDIGNTARQGAIAAAIGTLVTPLAAAIAFVDRGLAKDQNCSALLAGADGAKLR